MIATRSADLAITLGISKTNVSSAVRTTLALLLLFTKNAWSQQSELTHDIVTDRPDVMESSIVVPKGSLQFENGITWTTDHGNQAVDFSETLVRFGISTRMELRLVVPNYLKEVTGSNPSGLDDIAVGVKQQLGPVWGQVDLAVIAALSLPAGAQRISSRGLDPFIKFPWSKDIAKGWSVGGMQSFFWNTKAGRRNLVWEINLDGRESDRRPLERIRGIRWRLCTARRFKANHPLWHSVSDNSKAAKSIFTSASGSPRWRQSTF